jgi:hypothetical protein
MREEKDRRHEAVQGHTRAIARRRIARFGKDSRSSYGGVLCRHCPREERQVWLRRYAGAGQPFAKALIHWLQGCHRQARWMSLCADHP